MTEQSEENYTIADLSREFDVTARTLRFYEDEGLLSPSRSGRARVYSHKDRARVMWILRGKRVGFSLAEISEMLNLYELGDGRIKQRVVTLEKCRDRVEALKSQRDDIEDMITELSGFVDILDNIVQDPSSAKQIVSKYHRDSIS